MNGVHKDNGKNGFKMKKDLHNLPSLFDEITLIEENELRRRAAAFIVEMSNELKFNYNTISTACLFMHRFYLQFSFKKYYIFYVASACVLLAGKVEETPKIISDILNIAKAIIGKYVNVEVKLYHEDAMNVDGSGGDEITSGQLTHYERVLLLALKFDLNVSHPYSHLVKIAKKLKGKKEDVTKVLQTAWSCVNDSWLGLFCVQYRPEMIATAMLYYAFTTMDRQAKQFELAMPTVQWWGECLEVRDEAESDAVQGEMENICTEIINLYKKPKI